MAGTKPGPAPTGRKVKKVSVALRPEDVNVLQRLSLEIFSRQLAQAGAAGVARRMVFDWGERPSVSAAIRYLIDAERTRRLMFAVEAHGGMPPDKRPPLPPIANLLDSDAVFSTVNRSPDTATAEGAAFAEAYAFRLEHEFRWLETIVGRPAEDEAAQLATDTNVKAKPKPKKKAAKPSGAPKKAKKARR